MPSTLAPNCLVSFIISTHNRRDVLLDTLGHVHACGLRRDQFEVMLVDNASSDGTADAVADAFPDVRIAELSSNRGPVSRNVAIPHARGRYIVFLDDDSYPDGHSIRRMIGHFERDARLGAAVFTVTLPDGSQECSAYPNVFIGCGTGFRRRALKQVGGLPEDFFMAAEEYDLSLRMLSAGWDIRRFDDLHVTHLKTPTTRFSRKITRLDVRNNLLLIARYFPTRYRLPFMRDWLQRYYYIAAAKKHRLAFLQGMLEGLLRSIRPHRTPLDALTFEKFSHMEEISRRLRQLRQYMGLKRILLVDLGKNLHAFVEAARRCEIHIVGIADQKLCAPGRRARGIPVVCDHVAADMNYDAAIVANLSPVHAAQRRCQWRLLQRRPVIDFFELPDLESLLSASAEDQLLAAAG